MFFFANVFFYEKYRYDIAEWRASGKRLAPCLSCDVYCVMGCVAALASVLDLHC